MAVSSETFPPRKRRPSPDQKLLQSLTVLSQEISSLKPLRLLLKRNTTSLIRKSRQLSVLFEELHWNPSVTTTTNNNLSFPPSALLCFEELYIVLQRIKTLLEDCLNCSKMWLLIQSELISNSFHELTVELSTLLDIFPGKELHLNQDVVELLGLIRKQCLAQKGKSHVDSNDTILKAQVIEMLDKIKKEIVPDHLKLAQIFEMLNLSDSTSCRDEIEYLEDEIHNQTDEKSKSEIIDLIGLVRYAKCVLYGASTPRIGGRRRKTAADLNIPADFRCPISLDLMRDPVVVSTGQTYDRASIALWIESGHNTCPKTVQTLVHTELVPNKALRNLIAMWCREQRIPFEMAEDNNGSGFVINKTALTATKMTVSFLIDKLTTSNSIESANRLVHELRVLAKTDSDSRTCMANAGALPLLVKFLGSDNPSLQVNAVTTILNLSILEANKTKIVETDGVLNGVVEVLRSGATWEAKGNAAATIFSLAGIHAYRKKLGRKTRVIKGLVDLAKEGPTNSKRDAMVAILNLAGDREAVAKLIHGGVVDMVNEVMESMPEEAVTVLEVVVKRGGMMAVVAAYHMIPKLAKVLRDGTDRARESVAATLVNMCRKGGSEMVAALAAVNGVERVIWEIMGTGTGRGRRKAANLLRMLRRWAAGLVEGGGNLSSDTSVTITTTVNMVNIGSTRIVLPG